MSAELLPVNEVRITPQWKRYLETFIGSDGNKFAINLEKSIEKNIIKILNELDISGSVKSDRYSLPVQGTVISSVGYSSRVNDIYNSSAVKRKFLQTLLNESCRKVRFYVYVYTTEDEDFKGFMSMFAKKFNIEIRYYLH